MKDFYTMARQEGKSEATIRTIKYALTVNQSLAIGTNDVDGLYERIKAAYPEAKLTKRNGYLLVENAK